MRCVACWLLIGVCRLVIVGVMLYGVVCCVCGVYCCCFCLLSVFGCFFCLLVVGRCLWFDVG